jgi:hypothetical protein
LALGQSADVPTERNDPVPYCSPLRLFFGGALGLVLVRFPVRGCYGRMWST